MLQVCFGVSPFISHMLSNLFAMVFQFLWIVTCLKIIPNLFLFDFVSCKHKAKVAIS
jgi:hypothetical protein